MNFNIDGKAGLSAIFQRNHRYDQCTFACAVAFFVYPCHRTLPPLLLASGIIRTACKLSHTDLQAFLAPLLQLLRPKPKANQNAVRHGCLYMNSLTHFCTYLTSIHCGP